MYRFEIAYWWYHMMPMVYQLPRPSRAPENANPIAHVRHATTSEELFHKKKKEEEEEEKKLKKSEKKTAKSNENFDDSLFDCLFGDDDINFFDILTDAFKLFKEDMKKAKKNPHYKGFIILNYVSQWVEEIYSYIQPKKKGQFKYIFPQKIWQFFETLIHSMSITIYKLVQTNLLLPANDTIKTNCKKVEKQPFRHGTIQESAIKDFNTLVPGDYNLLSDEFDLALSFQSTKVHTVKDWIFFDGDEDGMEKMACEKEKKFNGEWLKLQEILEREKKNMFEEEERDHQTRSKDNTESNNQFKKEIGGIIFDIKDSEIESIQLVPKVSTFFLGFCRE